MWVKLIIYGMLAAAVIYILAGLILGWLDKEGKLIK